MSLSNLASQLAFVTRRLGGISLQKQLVPALSSAHVYRHSAAFAVTPQLSVGHTAGSVMLQVRSLRSSSSKSKKSKGRGTVEVKPPNEAATQHVEWVKFQQSIAVEGFDTGATTEIQNVKKSGGGKRKSKRDEMHERVMEQERMATVRGGEFPPERYSEEETERLLAQAYSHIPPRMGKRGTRNLKRQKRRWKLVREIRKKEKKHLAAFQIRKMATRSKKVKDIKSVIRESQAVRVRDREYQFSVVQRWNYTMAKYAETKASKHIEEAELV